MFSQTYLSRLMIATAAILAVTTFSRAQVPDFRPPAVPLVTSDPYLSIWSESDRLTDGVTRHWTRTPHPLVSLIRVDGQPFRLMGSTPASVPPLPQLKLAVSPTRTTYKFANSRVAVDLEFLSPALPDDLNLFSRPVTYLTWTVRSVDGQPHRVQIYDDTSSLISVNTSDQSVVWGKEHHGQLSLLHAGTQAQTLLRPAGDDTRIDWGYVYAAARADSSTIGSAEKLQLSFATTGEIPVAEDRRMPRPAHDETPSLAFRFDLGEVGKESISRHVMVGYDEVVSIAYYGQKLKPYWRSKFATPAQLFEASERDYDRIRLKAERFDRELMADATAAGGPAYAQILALSYRECVAANGLAADSKGRPLYFTKENTSNGDIATVDVIFPMAPIWVLLSPTLAKASLESNFAYAASPHWKFPNAPHDLGTYPQVFGRDDGGEGMPVEESGNMILLCDAIAHAEHSPAFAARWWNQLSQWAHYLEKFGLDPEDQLCTDDFMGHLAHNANLSVKAILALAAYGDLCRMRGDTATADRYHRIATEDAHHWVAVAEEGGRSRLAFDQPNTWSQKYNLVWDRILGLDIFPDSVAKAEVEFYKSKMLRYGLPLDSRTRLTKTDWSIWSATMAPNLQDFQKIVDPIYRYLQETTARDPIADSYITDNARSGGMHARPVVGGFFIKLLADPKIWNKWAARDRTAVNDWAPLPKIPSGGDMQEVIPTARTQKQRWQFSTNRPSEGWSAAEFDDSKWSTGESGFGTEGTPGSIIGTRWGTDDIWLRRKVTVPSVDSRRLRLLVHHDEDVEVFIDGIEAFAEPGFLVGYGTYPIDPLALKRMRPGAQVTVAVHCHQTTGGQYVDVGFGIAK